jgi:preprotein translocase subunit SecY
MAAARHYLPLRINHAGVMPIIFASSLLIFPSVFFGYLSNTHATASPEWWLFHHELPERELPDGGVPVHHLRDHPDLLLQLLLDDGGVQPRGHGPAVARFSGSFIPGLRPGPRTAEYLETVVERVTYVGAASSPSSR